MIDCSWLPDICECTDLALWEEYQENIYSIFKNDFISTRPNFDGKQVNIRKHPIEHGKEEAFFHVTCQDYSKDGNRAPDLRRCERIRWVRGFIENYMCDSNMCPQCSGIKIWDEPYQSTYRTHIMLEEEKYLVVVEKRQTYCLLITAFYFDQEHKLRKALRRSAQYA